jgi:hypothetical protein
MLDPIVRNPLALNDDALGENFTPSQPTNWLCGRCYQEACIALGNPTGELLPEHHRTCPKRVQ